MRLIGLVGKRGSGKSTIADNVAEAFPHVRVVAVADPIKRIVSAVYEGAVTGLWGDSFARDDAAFKKYLGSVTTIESFRYRTGLILNDFVHVGLPDVDDLYVLLRDLDPDSSIRDAVRLVGQWGRDMDPNFWTRYLRQTIDRIFASHLTYKPERGLSWSCTSGTYESIVPEFVVVPDVRFPREAGVIHELGGLTIRVEREVTAPRDSVDHDVTETAQDDIRADLVLKNDSDVATVTRGVRRLIS